jgi:hypothetical protein
MIRTDGFASKRKGGVRVCESVCARARRDMICGWCAFPMRIHKFGPEKVMGVKSNFIIFETIHNFSWTNMCELSFSSRSSYPRTVFGLIICN